MEGQGYRLLRATPHPYARTGEGAGIRGSNGIAVDGAVCSLSIVYPKQSRALDYRPP